MLKFYRFLFMTCPVLGALIGSACQQPEPEEDDCNLMERPDGWTVETHCKGIDADYEQVFDDSTVHRIDITVSAEDYAATMDNLGEILGSGGPGGGPLDDTEEPMYVPVTVEYNDLTWWHVGMRYKGNSSLHSAWRSDTRKLSFRFNFDKFEDEHPEIDDQRFYGFKKMTFSNGFKDKSLLRDKIAADLFREAGVPAARGTFVRVYVDFGEGPTYFGLYTMIEDPSDEMLETQFGSDEGNLYKPEGDAATWRADARTFVEDHFEKKTQEDQADWTDVYSAWDALHANRSNPEEWRANLEAVFDVDAFLRCLAVNQVIVNWDSYGLMNHNYYVYADPSNDGRIVWFPWDLNEAMLLNNRNGDVSTSIMLDMVNEEWPLIRYLLDDEEYRAQYKNEVQAFLDGPFQTDAVLDRLQANHDLIAPYLDGTVSEEKAPYTFFRNPGEFGNSLTGSEGLNAHVSVRFLDAQKALADD